MAKEDIQIRLKAALDTLDAAQSLGDYKKSLRELKGLGLEVGDSNSEAFSKIRDAIGETNDKIGDFNAVIKSASGEPIENVSNSFRGMKSSLLSLDMKSFKQQFSLFGDSLKGITSNFTGGFNAIGNFNKGLKDGKGAITAASGSFKQLAVSIAMTGLGALAIALVLVITNIDKLSEAGGLLGNVFSAIGDTIKVVMDKLIEFSDWLGLTDIKNQERSKNAIKAAQNERENITSRYDAEIRKAEAAGKSVDDLNKKKNAALAYSINQEILQYESLKKSKGKLNEDEQKELAELYKQRNNLVLENQIIDIKAEKERTDKANEQSKKRGEEKKKRDDKAKADEEKYQKDIQDLKDKYSLDEREKLAKTFDDSLKKIKLRNEEEKKLFKEIEDDKAKALKDFDDKKKKEEDDRIAAEDKRKEDKKKEDFEKRRAELEDEALLYEDDLNKQLEFLNKHYKELGMTDNEYAVAKKKLNDDITAKKKENDEKEKESEKQKVESNLKAAQDFLNAASALTDAVFAFEMRNLKQGTAEYDKEARKKFQINKALQIGSAIITGIQSVMSAYASGMTPPLGNPATATFYAITAGITAAANIAKIAATQYKSSASGGDSNLAGGGGGGGGNVNMNVPTAIPNTMGLGTAVQATPQKQESNWQKVYVVESDIRNTTNRVEVIESRSKLGS